VPASGSLKSVAVACSRVWQDRAVPGLRAPQRPERMPIRSRHRARSGRPPSTFGKSNKRRMIAPWSRLVGRSSDVTGNSRSDRQPVRKDRGNDSKWRQEPWLNAPFVDGAKLISGIASLALLLLFAFAQCGIFGPRLQFRPSTLPLPLCFP
jgi:hypothetical protein